MRVMVNDYFQNYFSSAGKNRAVAWRHIYYFVPVRPQAIREVLLHVKRERVRVEKD